MKYKYLFILFLKLYSSMLGSSLFRMIEIEAPKLPWKHPLGMT